MPVEGAEIVAKNIVAFGKGFTKHVNKVMTVVSDGLYTKVRANASLTDHSLGDFAELDHPYAQRHGAEGLPIHDPRWLVHTQSGTLLAAVGKRIQEASIDSGELTAAAICAIDESKAPHAMSVVFGTSKMVPRDFMTGSLNQYQPEADKYIRENLKDLEFTVSGRGTTRGG